MWVNSKCNKINQNNEAKMTDNDTPSKSETIELEDLETQFLNLRMGEVIPRLSIKEIKKITNSKAEDNFAGADFKYLILSRDDKALKVNTWVLWRKIRRALRLAGRIQVDLELKHTGEREYSVRVLQ